MVTDEEREAFTAALWKQHGDKLPDHIARQMGDMAAAKDWGGLEFWQDIYARADVMMWEARN